MTQPSGEASATLLAPAPPVLAVLSDRSTRRCPVSDESECTICEGGGGWWVTVPPQRAVGRIRCEHCEGTGVEPEPTPIEEEL